MGGANDEKEHNGNQGGSPPIGGQEDQYRCIVETEGSNGAEDKALDVWRRCKELSVAPNKPPHEKEKCYGYARERPCATADVCAKCQKQCQ